MVVKEDYELVKIIDEPDYIINIYKPKHKTQKKNVYNLHKTISRVLLNKYIRQNSTVS